MKTLLCFFAMLLAGVGYAQVINVLVTDIREERTLDQYYSGIELTIKINGIQIDENRRVKVGKITHAIDNLGNTLEEKTSSFGYDYKDRNEVSFKLQNPDHQIEARCFDRNEMDEAINEIRECWQKHLADQLPKSPEASDQQ